MNYSHESTPDDGHGGNGRDKRKKQSSQYRSVRGGKTLSIIYETNKPVDRKQGRTPFAVFMSILNLLLQSLYFLSLHEENYAFQAKYKDHLNDSWLDRTFNLQAVFACRVMLMSTSVLAVTFSDSGATLSFISKAASGREICKPWRINRRSPRTSSSW